MSSNPCRASLHLSLTQCLFLLVAVLIQAPACAQSVAATVTAGTAPAAVAVNPATNMVYVANFQGEDVTVINGTTGATTTVPAGNGAYALVVNPVTNKVYVANVNANTVTVIDGTTNTAITTVPVGTEPSALAVDPVTDKVYVANQESDTVSVIDGATNTKIATVTVGTAPYAVAVNPVTSTVYVANERSNNVTVINGATNAVTHTVTVGSQPYALGVNPVTNTVYVANGGSGNVTAINGATNSAVATVTVGSGPSAVAVNPVTNTVYVSNENSNSVSVINGATNAVTATVTAGSQPWALAVNQVTNTIYAANLNGNTVTVIDGSTSTAIATLNAGTNPYAAVVNPVTNTVYVPNFNSNNVTVIAGATNATTTVGVGNDPNATALNPVTNTVYVANQSSSTVSVIDGATNAVTATVSTGSDPTGIAVNPVTNMVYVTNYHSTDVTVIDGATNTVTTTVSAGSGPGAVAVNPVTNTVFVANYSSDNVTVIDGATNAEIATVKVGSNPGAVAVNPVTNTVYVANNGSNNVTVIDGAAYATTTVNVGSYPNALAVNPVTNKVYVSNLIGNTVTVIDGTTYATSTVDGFGLPFAAAVNPITDTIYVANAGANDVTVINGATNAVAATVSTGGNSGPIAVTVNPVTNMVYVANENSNNVTVIDGSTNSVTATLGAGTLPQVVVANPVTNTVYVSNNGDATVTAINVDGSQAVPLTIAAAAVTDAQTVSTTNVFQTKNVTPSFTASVSSVYDGTAVYSGLTVTDPPPTALYYSVDGGTWTGTTPTSTAGANPGDFSITLPAQNSGLHTLYLYAAYGNEGGGNAQGTGNSPEISNLAAFPFQIDPESTSTTVVSSGSPEEVGSQVTFMATVAPGAISGNGAPTGTVNFYDESASPATLLFSASLQADSGTYYAFYFTSSLSAGSHTIEAFYSGDANYQSSSGTVNEQIVGVSKFAVSAPSTVTAGSPFSITVTAQDTNGDTVAGYTGTVHFTTTDTGTGAAVPANYTFKAGDGGVHTFLNAAALVTAGNQSITATDISSSITGNSGAIEVSGTGPTAFAATGGNSQSGVVGVAFPTPLQVTLTDAYGNPYSGYVVSFTAPASGAGAGLSAGYCVTGTNGSCSVTATANATAGSYSVTASVIGYPGLGSVSFSLTNIPVPNFVVNVITDNDGGISTNCKQQTSTTANSTDANCELRDALAAAANSGAGNIYFDTSRFTSATTIQETFGPATMAIPANTSIYGLASPAITIQGNGSTSVFSLASGVSASISNLTITSAAGPGPSNGGGIFDNGASLSLSNATITGNAASNNGGGIYASGGALILSNSAISSNTGSALGGGIYITGGSLTIASSTIANNNPSFGGSAGGGLYVDGGATVSIAASALTGNQAASSGGAIQVASGTVTIAGGSTVSNNMSQGNGSAIASDGTLIVSDSTIFANAGPGAGGGIYVHSGSATLAFTTLSGNSASDGGALFINSGTAALTNDTISGNSQTGTGSGDAGGGTYVNSCSSCTMFNTILSGNVDAGPTPYPDDFGPWDPSSSNNLIGNDGGTSGLTNGANGNILGSQPMLSPMFNYGGPTQTMVPLPGSVAICAGSSSKVPGGTTTDQRGVTIGAGGYCPSGAVDIGAVQTDYSIKFTIQPPATGTAAGTAMSPAPQVTVSENGLAGVLPIDPATVSVTDAASNLATTPATAGTAAGVATFGSLIFTSAATGDTLTASLASPNISATSTAFTVAAASTTVSVPNAAATYSLSSQTLALSATVTSGAAGVNGGTVTFAVFNGATQIGSSVTSNTVSAGNASASYILPAGTAAGAYSIQATYNPTAAYAGSSETTATLTVSAAATTTTASSVTGMFGSPVTLSATVTSPAGVVNEGSITFVFGDGSSNGIVSVSNGSASVMHTYSSIGVYSIVALYNPGSGNFSTSTDVSQTVTIGQAIPSVTAWPTASIIAYGQTLAGSTLTGGSASVPGAFAWTNSATVPLAGTSSQSVTFTPTSADYAPVTDTVPLTVTAPNYVVNDKNDDNGTSTCTPLTSTTSNGTDKACSLRDALAAAANAGGGKIYFDATVFASAVTIAETDGTLVFPANADIFGLSSNTVTVQGNGSAPVFSVASGVTGLISHLTITGGGGATGGGIQNSGGTLTVSNSTITANSAAAGGGIYSAGGLLTLKNTTLTSNQATGGDGGGIDVVGGSVNITGGAIGAGNLAYGSGGGIATEPGAGPLTITNTTFAGNTAYTSGGAILSSSSLVVNDSTFSGNQANGGDAGAVVVSSGTASFNYSTFNNNTASNNGGGLDVELGATVTLANNTISGNTAAGIGGGIHVAGSANVTMGNNIVAGDTAASNADFADIDGAIVSLGNNVIGDGSGASGLVGSDQAGTTASPLGAQLGSLANNGGPTQTMIPQPGSPAICAGSASLIPSGAVTDQRGAGYPNTNTVYPTYPGYSGAGTPCVDGGAIQTAYALSFSTEPPSSVNTNVAMSPAPVVTLNGTANLAVTITDADTVLTGTTTATMSGSTATFSNLVLGSSIAGDTLTAALPLNSKVTLTATSTPVTSTQMPASISAWQGSGQSVQIGSPFASDLQAQVLDGGGVPIAGVFVTFSAPGAGAGGTFSNGTGVITVATNSSGIADSGPFTANNTAGSYDISASVSSLYVDFGMTNTPGAFSGLSLSFPSYFDNAPNAFTGWPVYVTVAAVDAQGNVISTNNDTIQVTSNDTQAVLPANFTLDQGWSTFQLTPNTVNASTSITATDLTNPTSANIAINVAATPNIVVNTKTDSNHSITNCTTSPEGTCSLRDALTAAYAAGAANITFDSTAIPSGSTLTLDSTLGYVDIPNDTRITGPYTGSGLTLSDGITLSGGGQTNVFTMGDPNAQGTIDGLAITGGTIIDLTGEPVSGAAILNNGTLTIMHSVISNNLAVAYGPIIGGAIYSDNDLEISNSTIANNTANSFLVEGAGIENDSYLNLANVTISGNNADAVTYGGAAGGAGLFTDCADISNSSISGNTALGAPDGSGTAAGGGIFAQACINITNTTISGNSAIAGGTATGGGIYDYYGDVHAYNVTISANSSDDGGGLNNAGGAAVLTNSIVAANVAPIDADIDGPLDPAGSYNLIGDGTGMTGIANGSNGNQVGVSKSPINPGLGLLAANGGPTQTMLPQPGSPAICAGSSALVPAGVTTDQRGVKIGVGGYCPSGDVDIGAVQTDYSLAFSQQPGDATVNNALTPAPAVLLTEGGIPFSGGSVVLTVAAGTLTGTSTQVTDVGGIATFSGISISPLEAADNLTATLSPSPAIAINSSSFSVENPVIPSLTSPSASSPLAGHITFTWNPGNVGASLYALWVGTTGVGSHDVYGSPQLAGTVTSQSVYIPLNGAALYVRLWYVVNGTFDYIDYTTFSEAQPPALTSPSSSSPLGGHTTFTWDSGTGAPSTFALWVGTTGTGSHDLYGSPQLAGTVTSQSVNIPLNGAQLFVRLWYVVNAAWNYIDYTTFSEAQAPALTSPSSSSPLAGHTTFTWSPGTATASTYSLWIGTTGVGSHDLYGSPQLAGTVTSQSVNIPLNGAKLYIRLWYVVSGAWNYIDYSSFSEAQAPALTSPSGASLLAGKTTFTWSTGTGAPSLFALWVGTAGTGSHDLYGSPQFAGTVTSQTVNIPLNGAQLYVRLWYVVNDAWDYIDYTGFTEGQAPALTSPTGPSLLAGKTTFTWSSGSGAPSIFELSIGTTAAGSHDVYDSGLVAGTVTSETVNIPLNGARLYVRLWYVVNGAFDYIDYTTFNEAQAPALTSPSASSPLGGHTTFSWSSGTATASMYELWIGTTGTGSHDLYGSPQLANTVTSESVNIPLNGVQLYVRLWYVVNGAWDYTDYTTFTEAQAPALTAPLPSSTLAGATKFTWSSGTSTPSLYALWVGTAGTGSHDVYGSPQFAGSVTSQTVNIPQNGATLYVRLWYVVNGAWDYTDYTTFSEKAP